MPASHTAAQKSRVAGERTGGAGRGRRRDRAADEPRRLRPPSRLTPVLPSSRRPGLRVRLRAGRRGAGCSRPPMPPSGLRGQAGHAGRSLEPRKDLAVVSRLLPPKLVARKAQHDQAGGLQLLLERVQLCRGNSEGGRGAPGLEGPLRTERAQATPVPARGAHRAALEPPSQGRAAPSASSGAARRGPWAHAHACSTALLFRGRRLPHRRSPAPRAPRRRVRLQVCGEQPSSASAALRPIGKLPELDAHLLDHPLGSLPQATPPPRLEQLASRASS